MNSKSVERKKKLLRDIREKESELGALHRSLEYLHRQLDAVDSLPSDMRSVQHDLVRKSISNVESNIRWCETDLEMLRSERDEIGT